MAMPELPKKNHQILIVDPSASHLAYVIATFDFTNKELHINHCGMLWTNTKWSRGQRFLYMNRCFDHLMNPYNELLPTSIVSEAYFMNPRMLSTGVAVIPTVNGLLEMTAASYKDILYFEVPPPSWRSMLGIKPTKDANGKRDYKEPTLKIVESSGIKIPEEILSNITLKSRATPYDISDVLAITLALAKANNVTNTISVGNAAFLPSSLIEKFNKISKEI